MVGGLKDRSGHPGSMSVLIVDVLVIVEKITIRPFSEAVFQCCQSRFGRDSRVDDGDDRRFLANKGNLDTFLSGQN